MTDRRLPVGRDLGERAVVRRIEEDRVVAEAGVAGRRLGDPPLDRAGGFEHDAAAVGRRHGADEPRGTGDRAAIAQARVDDVELLSVGRAVETRGVDARLAVETLDLEPGVVRHRQMWREPPVVQSFQPRVLGERLPGFRGSRSGAECRHRADRIVQAREDARDFGELVRVRRGDNDGPDGLGLHDRVARGGAFSRRWTGGSGPRFPAVARRAARSRRRPAQEGRPARADRRVRPRPCPGPR